MSELMWGWPEICVTLFWRLAPAGVVINRADLHALPVDRVLREDRDAESISFRWISLEAARLLSKPLIVDRQNPPEKAGVSEMQGRWQKIACVLLWKLARDGVRLTQADRSAVPSDRVLLAEGHADDIEYRFVPREEARRIQQQDLEREGRMIMEATHV